MRLYIPLVSLFTSVLAVQSSDLINITTVSIQPISVASAKPITVASISFNPSTLDSELSSYSAPDLFEYLADDLAGSKYLRVGIYDASTSAWKSATSLTSAETFAKGYSPTFVLNLSKDGNVIGVSVKGSRIDAGQTRDFGPKVKAVKMSVGKQPDLNRPVVLKEGKVEVVEPEKTFLQKYWWMLLAGMMLVMTAGGGAE